jgi:hypothetical protein
MFIHFLNRLIFIVWLCIFVAVALLLLPTEHPQHVQAQHLLATITLNVSTFFTTSTRVVQSLPRIISDAATATGGALKTAMVAVQKLSVGGIYERVISSVSDVAKAAAAAVRTLSFDGVYESVVSSVTGAVFAAYTRVRNVVDGSIDLLSSFEIDEHINEMFGIKTTPPVKAGGGWF